MFSPIVPSNRSKSCGRYPIWGKSSLDLSFSGIGAVTVSFPPAIGQIPVIALASADYPDPVGPITPNACPGPILKLASRSAALFDAGGNTVTWASWSLGFCVWEFGGTFCADMPRICPKSRKLVSATDTSRNCCERISSGPSARDISTVAAIIAPGVS